MGCGFQLVDGSGCDLPIHYKGGYQCRFHEAKTIDKSNSELLTDYIKENKNPKLLDLSEKNFKNYYFDPTYFKTHKQICFNNSNFTDCTFKGIFTGADLFFDGATFTDTIFSFCNIEHCNKVSFMGARFIGQQSTLNYCTIIANSISFADTSFKDMVNPFRNSLFKAEEISFEDINIESDFFTIRLIDKDTDLYDHRYLSVFAEKLDFNGMRGNSHFEITNGSNNSTPEIEIELTHINFSQFKSATFLNTCLTKTRLIYSRIENVYFINVKWPLKNSRFFVYGKIDKQSKMEVEENKRIYVQLKKNYDDQRNYSTSGDWYYREIECQQLLQSLWTTESNIKKIGQLITKLLYYLYWLISKYGESYHRPIYLIVIILVLSAFGYQFSGFELTEGEFIDYEWGSAGQFKVSDYFQALLYSAKAMFLQVGKNEKNPNIWWHVIYLFQLFANIILIPLLLLALRRKFKR